MSPLFKAIVNLCVSMLCSFVAINSDISFAAAIWGFSAGMWFNLSMKYFFEWLYLRNT